MVLQLHAVKSNIVVTSGNTVALSCQFFESQAYVLVFYLCRASSFVFVINLCRNAN